MSRDPKGPREVSAATAMFFFLAVALLVAAGLVATGGGSVTTSDILKLALIVFVCGVASMFWRDDR